MWFVIIGVIGFSAWLLLASSTPRKAYTTTSPQMDPAFRIARERLARGEMTASQYADFIEALLRRT
jgi:uncharacterized membrane protein